MVLSWSGRFSVMVATDPAVEYSSVSKSVVGIVNSAPEEAFWNPVRTVPVSRTYTALSGSVD